MREKWILLQWLSSILGKNFGLAGVRTSELLFGSTVRLRLSYVCSTGAWHSHPYTLQAKADSLHVHYLMINWFNKSWHTILAKLGIELAASFSKICTQPTKLHGPGCHGIWLNKMNLNARCIVRSLIGTQPTSRTLLKAAIVGLMTWWLWVRSPVQAAFLSGVFSPLTSAEACEKSSVSTGVRKPGNTYASPTAMIWP